MSEKIAFVGVGRMGANMARRLAEKGFQITALYDVRRETATALQAAGWAVLRAWDFEIHRDLSTTLARITDILRQRAGGTAAWQRHLTRA